MDTLVCNAPSNLIIDCSLLPLDLIHRRVFTGQHHDRKQSEKHGADSPRSRACRSSRLCDVAGRGSSKLVDGRWPVSPERILGDYSIWWVLWYEVPRTGLWPFEPCNLHECVHRMYFNHLQGWVAAVAGEEVRYPVILDAVHACPVDLAESAPCTSMNPNVANPTSPCAF